MFGCQSLCLTTHSKSPQFSSELLSLAIVDFGYQYPAEVHTDTFIPLRLQVWLAEVECEILGQVKFSSDNLSE